MGVYILRADMDEGVTEELAREASVKVNVDFKRFRRSLRLSPRLAHSAIASTRAVICKLPAPTYG